MDIEWDHLRNLDDTVSNINNVLNKKNVSIFGDFIKNDYVYEYKYNTCIEDLLMKKDEYNNMIYSKDIPDYIEDYYIGVRDFKGSLLYSRDDKDLDSTNRGKLVIAFMIVAVAHFIYEGDQYKFPKLFKSSYDYIKQYGYDLNWKSNCCFPFEIKSEYTSEDVKIIFLEETIIEAICNYVMFKAYGKRNEISI